MTKLEDLLARNRGFAASVDPSRLAMPDLSALPERLLLVLTCVDPRVEPAGFLGIDTGDAGVLRNAGGRVDNKVIEDIAYLAMRLRVRLDVAIIHHTQCGTGLLADPEFRASFAARTGLDEEILALKAVTDPAATVRHDVARLLNHPSLSGDTLASVSGHVLRLETGLVETMIKPTSAVRESHQPAA